MQDKEVDLIPTNHPIHDLVSRFARPSLDRASNRVSVLAKYEDTLATRGPAPGQVGQQRNRNQNEQHTRSKHHYEVLSNWAVCGPPTHYLAGGAVCICCHEFSFSRQNSSINSVLSSSACFMEAVHG